MGEAAVQHHIFTEEEYYELEESAPERHYFYRGEIHAMAGASLNHERIVARISRRLNERLDGSGCEAVGSNLKVKAVESDLVTYPDVTVLCGRPETDRNSANTILNPRLLAEVLSKSTTKHDPTIKLQAYLRIPTLSDCLLVWQDMVRVEHHFRVGDGEWQFRRYLRRADSIQLDNFNFGIPLEEIYFEIDVPDGAISIQCSE